MCDWNELYRKKSQPESFTKIMSIGFSLSYNLPFIWLESFVFRLSRIGGVRFVLRRSGCWIYTGERQVSALRKRYLEAVLKQDVGFYNTDARTGDTVFSVSTDTLLVQDAISEKVGNFIPYLSMFLAGLVVGFVSARKLALLSVAVIPGIAFAGGLYTGLTSKSRESYANAGIIAEQMEIYCMGMHMISTTDNALSSSD
ncbi:putative ABC transporter type 1, transmembrane domain-containing protein [Helianthus annuus]|nr:putative ABC transporter type 1, transmembrane domain-containing protein [Helianthus annuus]KAJ0461829.1 putative Type 1 protein exporter [Helianthus annuus]KAJ0642216.1 putative Type 1 protein exporter [Helianthus annuus]